MRNKFINGAKVCAHLKNLFTKGGADSVNNYADYINKQSQKKKLSLERIQELNEISLTISWWKENVMKKLDRASLQEKKHQQESKKEQRLISYFVNNITSGKWTLDDIKSEAYRELVKDYFEASPFGLPQNNQALVMADSVQETVMTMKQEDAFSKATKSEELDNIIEEYKSRFVSIHDKAIETYEDLVDGCKTIAQSILKYVDLSEYKEYEYGEIKVFTVEELTNRILYSTYSSEETTKHVKVTKLDDEEYIRGVNFCGLKCCSIDEAIEYIDEGRKEFDATQHVMAVQAYIDFDDELEYQKYIHLGLMCDQTWLSGENHFGGGAYCNLDTLETFTYNTDSKLCHDVYYMKKEERKAKGIGSMTAGVIIRVNGVNRIAIDPQGYSYSRYVGILPEKEVIYTKPESEFWLTEEEEKMIEDAKAGREWSIIDFGASRSKNENFWNELKKLGTVKIDSCMWSFKGAAA